MLVTSKQWYSRHGGGEGIGGRRSRHSVSVVQLSDVSRSRECDDEDKEGEIRRAANLAVGTLRSVPPSPFPRLMSAVYRHKSAGLWIQMSSHGAHSLFHLETGTPGLVKGGPTRQVWGSCGFGSGGCGEVLILDGMTKANTSSAGVRTRSRA
jgi:hypothetical protein